MPGTSAPSRSLHSLSPPSSPSSGFPLLTRAAVDACAFPAWHGKFKRITPKATVLPVDAAFIEYLKADGVFLPGADEEDEEDGESDNSSDEDTAQYSSTSVARFRPNLNDLTSRIQEVLDEYQAVFPKLNWTSPQDAAWMVALPNLQCTTPEDVFLALKASDFILNDLDHAYDDCLPEEGADAPPSYSLVLKKWYAIPPSHEFRCFVLDHRLAAISQRDTNYYDFLQQPERRSELCDLIERFFDHHVRVDMELSHYVLDVYVTRDEDRVFLIDINPYAPRTDPLLFSWDELHSLPLQSTGPLLRLVESELQASQSMPKYSHNRYPKDVVGLSDGASIAAFAEQWREALSESGATQTSQQQRSSSPIGR